MKRYLHYFLQDCKRSKVFIIILLVELCLCMVLTNMAMHLIKSEKDTIGYYNYGMADKIFAEFVTDGDMTINELSKNFDVSELATVSEIGDVDGQLVRVVTPTAVRNMPKQGLKFSKNLPKDYREIYINYKSAEELGYKKGKFYEMPINDSTNTKTQRVKVIGYFDDDLSYYAFTNFSNIMNKYNDIIMCDELGSDAVIKSAIFYNDVDALLLKKEGHLVKLGSELYNGVSNGQLITYLTIVVLMLTAACTLTNYLLNIDKMRKRYAVQYVTGMTYKEMYMSEAVKHASIFSIAVIINAILTAFLSTDSFYGTGLTGYPAFGMSVGIVGLIYLVTLFIGLFKLRKIEPLESVRL